MSGPEPERRLEAHHADRLFQAAGHQFVFERGPNRTHPAVRNTLPRDTPAFTGREAEISALVDSVTGSTDPNLVIAIHAIDGMPGIGKTAFAVHVAHLLSDHFVDGQLYIDLHAHSSTHAPVDPADALSALLTADGMGPDQIAAQVDARAAQWRARMAGKRVLLIMDNAGGHGQVEPLLPGAAGCLVLITSRRRLTGLAARHATVPLTLDTLAPVDAARLFRRLVNRPVVGADVPRVDRLVALCGYLPLAISLLAAKLRPEPRWTIADLLDDLVATHDRLAQMKAEDLAVAAAFELSYRHLPAARKRFFRRLGLFLGTDIDQYAAAALEGSDLGRARGHLEALYDDHLLDQPVRGRYRLHDLIGMYARDLARSDPPADRAQAVARVLDYYQDAARLADRCIDPHATHVMRERPRTASPLPVLSDPPEAIGWLRRELPNLFACVTYNREHDDGLRVVALSEALSAFLCRTGHWNEAADLHRAAAAAAYQQNDPTVPARALRNLGVVLRRAGDYAAAEDVLRRALTLVEPLADERAVADLLNEIGNVYRSDGHFGRAAGLVQSALAVYRRVGDELGEARALLTLAVILWLTDDFSAAETASMRALEIFRSHQEPFGCADALFRLGVIRRMTADYSAAAEVLTEALALYEDLGDRLGRANARHCLAVVQHLARDYAGAAAGLDEALAIFQDLGDRRGIAITLRHRGILYTVTGDLVRARAELDRALDAYARLGDRLGRAAVTHSLGVVGRLAGDTDAATRQLDDALALYRAVGNHRGQAEVHNEIGLLLVERGDAISAQAHYRSALTLAREVRSPLEEARAIEGTGRCAAVRGDVALAVAGFTEALRIYRRIGSADAARMEAALAKLSAVPPAA